MQRRWRRLRPRDGVRKLNLCMPRRERLHRRLPDWAQVHRQPPSHPGPLGPTQKNVLSPIQKRLACPHPLLASQLLDDAPHSSQRAILQAVQRQQLQCLFLSAKVPQVLEGASSTARVPQRSRSNSQPLLAFALAFNFPSPQPQLQLATTTAAAPTPVSTCFLAGSTLAPLK